jgi:hypothetical protein
MDDAKKQLLKTLRKATANQPPHLRREQLALLDGEGTIEERVAAICEVAAGPKGP